MPESSKHHLPTIKRQTYLCIRWISQCERKSGIWRPNYASTEAMKSKYVENWSHCKDQQDLDVYHPSRCYVCGSFRLIFVLLVLLGLNIHVPLFSYVWISESPPIWERAADSVYHLLFLMTSLHIVTSFPWYIVSGVWDLFVLVPDCWPLLF